MPTNHTPHYNLSQWERDDRILMEDFNEDNTKIDTALARLEETAAEHAAALARRGNCQVYTTTYTGNGGSSKSLYFPGKPLLIVIMYYGGFFLTVQGVPRAAIHLGGTVEGIVPQWSGNSVSWPTPNDHYFNTSSVSYTVVAFLDAEK